jgi:hypothetical protein
MELCNKKPRCHVVSAVTMKSLQEKYRGEVRAFYPGTRSESRFLPLQKNDDPPLVSMQQLLHLN